MSDRADLLPLWATLVLVVMSAIGGLAFGDALAQRDFRRNARIEVEQKEEVVPKETLDACLDLSKRITKTSLFDQALYRDCEERWARFRPDEMLAEQLSKAYAVIDNCGTKRPGMSYEEGVAAALEWGRDVHKKRPMDND